MWHADSYYYKAIERDGRVTDFSGTFDTIDEAEMWLTEKHDGTSNGKFWEARHVHLVLFLGARRVELAGEIDIETAEEARNFFEELPSVKNAEITQGHCGKCDVKFEEAKK
jgi:hypothetical protein